MSKKLTIPLLNDAIAELVVGDAVLLSGIMINGGEKVHKWLVDTFVKQTRQPTGDDLEVYRAIIPILDGGVIYHCEPVMTGLDTRHYRFVTANPATASADGSYHPAVMRFFNLKGVIGEAGPGAKTLQSSPDANGAYFYAIGGDASLVAQSVNRVLEVYRLEFGISQAIWVLEVNNFPAVITTDSHGASLHETVRQKSQEVLGHLLT